MVPRYSRPEMTAIWSAENRYRIWFAIEVFAAEAMGKVGMIPAEDAAKIRKAYDEGVLGEIDVTAIDEIEAVTKHDVIAFLTWAGEKLGPERRWLHQGMTSSDVLDTALAVQLKQAADLLIADLGELLAALKRRAFEHKMTPTIGRSHGIHAEPTSFGLKLAQAYAEFDRNRTRLITARDEIATTAISGAVGTFANVDQLPAGVRVDVMIRPDDITFVPQADGAGTITRRYFRGSETVYCIRLPSGDRVHSSQPSASVLPTGMRVRPEAHVLHVVAFEK